MNDLYIKSRWELPVEEPKTLTREARIDELTRDAKYRTWEWMESLDVDALQEIVSEVTHACWRGQFRDDEERLYAIKDCLDGFIDSWAENEAEDEE